MKHATLINAVANINGASFVGLDTHTDVTLTGGKSNPHQGRVTKRMTGATVMSFQNKNFSAYEAMIKRRLVVEGKAPEDFKLGERAWGVRLPNMPIVEHKGEYYLEVIFMKPGVVSYELDGNPVDGSFIIGLKSSNAGEQGGLEDKVIIRTFKAESISELRIDGKTFN
jgi:hypothetical protein